MGLGRQRPVVSLRGRLMEAVSLAIEKSVSAWKTDCEDEVESREKVSKKDDEVLDSNFAIKFKPIKEPPHKEEPAKR